MPNCATGRFRQRHRVTTNPRTVVGRHSTSSGSRSRYFQWGINVLLVASIFAISFAINADHVRSTELHPDETRWLNRANYLQDFQDPYGKTWQDYYISRGQPPGGSYLLGLGLLLQGEEPTQLAVWDFNYGSEWNTLAGAIPERDVLIAGRNTNAVLGALVVVLIFMLASMLTNRIGGIFAALFLAYHPLQITLSTQALSDELLAFALAVTFVAAFRFAKRPSFGWALLMGVALGLGGATKLAPLALSFVLAGFGVLWLAWQWRQHGRAALRWPASRRGLLLFVQPVISGLTFVAMYPFLWVDPIGRSLDLLEFRTSEMASQARVFPWAKVDNPREAFMRYGEQLHDAASTTKHLQRWMNDRLGFSIDNPVSLDFIVVAIGAILLLRIVINHGLWSPHAMVALLMAAEVAAVTVGLGVDFYRYYLPVLLVNSVLVGVAFGEAASGIRHMFARNRTPSAHHLPAGSSARWETSRIPRESAS